MAKTMEAEATLLQIETIMRSHQGSQWLRTSPSHAKTRPKAGVVDTVSNRVHLHWRFRDLPHAPNRKKY